MTITFATVGSALAKFAEGSILTASVYTVRGCRGRGNSRQGSAGREKRQHSVAICTILENRGY